jgi:hypothetical protein
MRQRTGLLRRLAISIKRIASPAAMPMGRKKTIGAVAPCQLDSVTSLFSTMSY